MGVGYGTVVNPATEARQDVLVAAEEETNEEREQTLNQLLTEMDGFTPDIGVVFIGATNRADLLDPALMRAGRFDKKFRIAKPDTQGRFDVLKVGTSALPDILFNID